MLSSNEYPSQRITRLRKSGNLAQALNLARSEFENESSDKYIFISYSWVLYDLIKQANDDEVPYNFFNEYITICAENRYEAINNELRRANNTWNQSATTGPLYHSLILSKANQYCERWKGYIDFICNWKIEFLRDEDWSGNIMNNGVDYFPSLAENTAKSIYKHIKYYSKRDKSLIWVTEFIDDVIGKSTDEWMIYRQAKIVLWLGGNREDILLKLKPLARKKRNEFWMWEVLAELNNNKEEKLMLFCKAICCSAKESFKIELYRVFGIFLAEEIRNYPIAKSLLNKYKKLRENNNKTIPDSMKQYYLAKWFIDTDEVDIIPFCKKNANDVTSFIYSDLQWMKANYVEKFNNKNNKLITKFAMWDAKQKQLVFLKFKDVDNNSSNLKSGEAVYVKSDIKIYSPDFHLTTEKEYPILDPSETYSLFLTKSRDSKLYDLLEEKIGIVSNVNTKKSVVTIYLNKLDYLLLYFDKWPNANNLKCSDTLTLFLEKLDKGDNRYEYRIFSWALTDQAEIPYFYEGYISHIIIPHEKSFGFINVDDESVFIPPTLIVQGDINNKDKIKGWAINKWNIKKNNFTWQALTAEKVLDE